MSSSESITVNLAEEYTPSNIQSIVVYSPTGDSEVVVDEVLNGCVIELLNEDDVVLYSTPVITQGKHYNRFDGADISNASFSETPSISAIIEPPTGESDKIQTWDLTTDSISSPSFTNTLVESIDGINWNTSITNNMNKINSVLWNGFRWLIGGEGGDTLAYSLGGNDWTGITESVFDSHVSNISYDSKTPHINIQHPVLACMEDSINTLAYSVDGIRWNGLGNSVFSEYGTNVFWNGYMWVAVGKGSNTIGYSLNLLDWKGLGESIFSIEGKDVHYDKNKWVAVGSGTDHTIGYSYDGFNWRGLGNSIFSVQGNSCYYNGSIWIAVGEGTQHTIAKSTDGITWTGLSNTIFSVRGTCVIFTGKLWLATGSGTNSLAYSEDGTTWVGLGLTIFSTQGNSVSYDDHKLMACGEGTNTIATSQDGGLTWVGNGLQTFSTRGNNIEYNGKWWMACGEGTNSFIYSNNGETWNRSLDSLFSSSWVLSPVTITVDSEYIGPGNSVYKYITSDSSGNGSLFGTINAVRGSTLTIYVVGEYVELVSHPIKITEYNDQGQHMAPLTGVVRTDTGGQNNDGTYNLTWTVPTDTTVNKYQYQCENHAHMRGIINVSSSVVKGISVNKLYRDRYIPNQHYLQHKLVVDVGDSLQSGVTQVDFGYKTNEYNLEVPLNEVSSNIIQLSGNSTITIEKGYNYSEPGVVYPSEYNLLSDGTVNENVVGSYLLTYSLLDQFGIVIKSISRTVIVEDTVIPIITLLGDLSITVEKDHAYVEPGYTALDYYNEDISNNIIINSNVDLSTPGVYNITYDLKDNANNSAIQKTRTITVHDTTLPVITLIGGSYIEIPEGSTYNELGASATDFENIDLTPFITIDGNVDTSTGGTYSVRYNVGDFAGNNAIEVIRTVVIGDLTGPVITLIGGTIELFVGDSYVEPGFTAIDLTDGDVSNNVVITNTINNAVVGVYNVKYNVSDVAGNASEATRIVKVKSTVQTGNTSSTWQHTWIQTGDQDDAFVQPLTYQDIDIVSATFVQNQGNTLNPIRIIKDTTNTNYFAFILGSQEGSHFKMVYIQFEIVSQRLKCFYANAAFATYNNSGQTDQQVIAVYHDSSTHKETNTRGADFNLSRYGVKNIVYSYYETIVDTTAPVITLNGDSSVDIYAGDSYVDEGATAIDDIDGDITSLIVTTSTVNVDISGTYTVKYNVDDLAGNSANEVIRTVNVLPPLPVVEHIYSTFKAFAALKTYGTVVTWGDSSWGGDFSSAEVYLSSGVSVIYSTSSAFAAVKNDGSVVTWGDSTKGGDSSSMSSSLSSGVSAIYPGSSAFAALKNDGSVVTWGKSGDGGDSSSVASSLSSGVSSITSTSLGGFAALKNDGSVVNWGNSSYGGDSSSVSSSLSSGVSVIYSTNYSFAALKTDGSVVVWGSSNYGGNSSSVSSFLTSGVSNIYSTDGAFAALKNDGSVVVWGNNDYGGDSSSVSSFLSSGVSIIYPNSGAFAALKSNGSVTTWGPSTKGGDSSSVSSSLSSGVSVIYYTNSAFAALKTDGSVVTWGDSTNGGNSSSVFEHLTDGVISITSTDRAFAALKNDGSVITWGNSSDGGNSSSIDVFLSDGVSKIFSTGSAFAALKDDDSVITWGDSSNGGDSLSVAHRLAPENGIIQYYVASTPGVVPGTSGEDAWTSQGGISADGTRMLVGIYKDPNIGKVLYSHDSGNTWNTSTINNVSGSTLYVRGVHLSDNGIYSLFTHATTSMDVYYSSDGGITYNALSKPGSSYYQTQGIKVNEEGTIAIITSYVGVSGYNVPFFVGYINKDNLSSTSWNTVYTSGWDRCYQFCANSDYSHVFMMMKNKLMIFNNSDTSKLTDINYWNQSTISSIRSLEATDCASSTDNKVIVVTSTNSTSNIYFSNDYGESFYSLHNSNINYSGRRVEVSANGDYIIVWKYEGTNSIYIYHPGDNGDYSQVGVIDNLNSQISFCHISNNGTILVQRGILNSNTSNKSWVVKHLPSTYVPPTWFQKGQTINGTSAQDQFGTIVAISGDGTVIAGGAIYNDGNGTSSGQVQIYKFENDSWNVMGSFIYGESGGDHAGITLGLSYDGNIIAIGGHTNDGNGTDSGHVRVYEYNGSSWVKLGGDIDGEASGDRSAVGLGLSSDGTIVAIGAQNNDGNGSNSGHVRVYQYNGSSWVKIGQDIDGEASNDSSGWKTTINSDGTIVAIGASGNDGNGSNSGHVRVYEYNGSSWVQLGQDINGRAANSSFGAAVSISADGKTVAAGGYGDNLNGTNSGYAAIYEYNGTSWVQMGSNIHGNSGDWAGWALSLDSTATHLAVGFLQHNVYPGYVKTYEYDGSSWTEFGETITTSTNNDRTGTSLSFDSSGNTLIIGSCLTDYNTTNSGSVSVYERI